MTFQTPRSAGGDARASIQGRRPAQVGKIEKAHDARRALQHARQGPFVKHQVREQAL